MKFIRATLISFLISVVTLAPVFLNVADAGLTAKTNNSSGTLSVSTGTFILYATTTPGGANPRAALPLNTSAKDQYFYLNTGTINIAKFSLNVTGTQTFTLAACPPGVTFTGSGTCASGSTTSISSTPGEITLAIAANSWIEIDINSKKALTANVSVSVSFTQIRSPITTNS